MKLEELKRAAADFDLLGIADPFCAELQRAPDGHKPQDYLPGVKSVISLGVKVIDAILQTAPSGIYSKHYDTLNVKLNSGAYELARQLEKQGFESIAFPETDSCAIFREQYDKGYTGFVPCFNHLAAAVAAGLGRMGACGVVLTPEYGPRQRWITVITKAELPFNKPLPQEICRKKKGEECFKCAGACLIKAISEKGTEVRRCWKNWDSLRDKGLACGLCIKACPIGRNEK